MKTLFLILTISFLGAPILAQQAFTPTRVSVTAETEDEYDRELKNLVRAELRRDARVAFVSKRGDFDVTLTAGPLSDDSKCRGFIVAMVVADEHGRRRLSIHTGASLAAVAKHLAQKLDAEYFQGRGR